MQSAVKVMMGKRELEFGGRYLGEMRDVNDLLGDRNALHERMTEDGYILIRGLHRRQAVLEARRAVCQFIRDNGSAIRSGTDLMDAKINAQGRLPQTLGNRQITHAPAIRRILEAKSTFEFFDRYFDGPARTFDYKWLRAVGTEGFTGSHYDVVYMGRGSGQLLTCWVPLGDIPIEQGTLCLCVGSNSQPGFENVRKTYGRMDVDRDRVQGTFSNDPIEIADKFGGRWCTTGFEAGDVVIFTMFTMHGSTNNTTDQWRLSCDTRFQPASDPVDKRWIGENPIAHYSGTEDLGKTTPISEARAKWGV